MRIEEFIIVVHVKDGIGSLKKITDVFLEKRLSILNLNFSESEAYDYCQISIHAYSYKKQLTHVIDAINKKDGVQKTYAFAENRSIHLEIILFKMKSFDLIEKPIIQSIINEFKAEIIEINRDYFIISKVGTRKDIAAIEKKLLPHGLQKYSKSGSATLPYN